ncbi:excisionase family DNA-binding protein [Arsenicicoccus piscis]|uniref:Helix-turn-helix domain-containing protein n=1 Tax=Arsenicicoccus piscis TaxID=673954 RepID=A0ABQ6HTX3_9MICO|nr:excisionase family DNA-binding protein [Arsenicicoccus piscis]MCH8627362.1 excisionase family DNA-binding protein [Arsenicicoccus piscis]GMA21511.1 hypothetical protein GCM10025862_35320 [Arsenicicoccus piscis]GMA22170.1 hypothetical protein GCM10025862_41930 [Arsenicicoccus piscis]GMA22218.1 hypothetical protein GCM10025862_42410 [Arsenicicoccus piscis]
MTLTARTYLPATHQELTPVEQALTDAPNPQAEFALRGPRGDVPLPEPVYEILQQVVTAMQAGKAITVTPNDPVLTTQQAADLLGVTRPTLVKFLDEGRMPFERVSTRRKVRLQDVLEYRERRKEEQCRALAEVAAPFDDEDLETVLAQAKAARKAVAARRRAQAAQGS